MKTETQTLTCSYIDTCYPDYLQDHHNRENELLIGIPADYDYWDWLKQDLFNQAINSDRLPDFVTNSLLQKAINEAFECYRINDITSKEDECYIYACLSW